MNYPQPQFIDARRTTHCACAHVLPPATTCTWGTQAPWPSHQCWPEQPAASGERSSVRAGTAAHEPFGPVHCWQTSQGVAQQYPSRQRPVWHSASWPHALPAVARQSTSVAASHSAGQQPSLAALLQPPAHPTEAPPWPAPCPAAPGPALSPAAPGAPAAATGPGPFVDLPQPLAAAQPRTQAIARGQPGDKAMGTLRRRTRAAGSAATGASGVNRPRSRAR